MFAGTPRLDALDPSDLDMTALNLQPIPSSVSPKFSAVVKDRQKLLEEVRSTMTNSASDKLTISLVVIG